MLREFAEFEEAETAVSLEALESALFGRHPIIYAYVADVGDGIAGLISWYLTFSSWTGRPGVFVQDFYVRPQFRARGYGAQLFASLAQECVKQGYARMDWWVLEWNKRALNFYGQRGAETLGGWKIQRLSGEALYAAALEVQSWIV